MKIKIIALFISLTSLVLPSCGIRITPHSTSSSSVDPASTWTQPEEHGDGNYNYDELEFADVEQIIKDYWTEHFEEGARWNNVRGFSDVDVYFYNRETGVKKDRDFTFSYMNDYEYGQYDLRAVGYFNGHYYKLEIDLNNSQNNNKGYFDVAFDEDDTSARLNNNKKGYYGMSALGYDGDYHFIVKPRNSYLKDRNQQFEFRAHVNHDRFQLTVRDINVYQPCDTSYSGMSASGNTKLYYASVVDDAIGEYSIYKRGDMLPIGKYAMKAVAILNDVTHETEVQYFNVLPLTFDGCEYDDNLEFTYKGVHLSNYNPKMTITMNGREMKNVRIKWNDSSQVIDMTTAVDGVVSFNEQVVFSLNDYADYLTDVHVRILINGFAHPGIADVVYNGEEQQPKVTNFVEELMEFDDESVLKATNVGEYQAVARFKKGIQGKFADGTTESTVTWHITKANPETYYSINNIEGYYELELEDSEGTVVSAGKQDNFNYKFAIPSAAVGKRAYVRLYRVVNQTRKLVETDDIAVTTAGELSQYGFDFDKRAVYFECDAYGFEFRATLKLGAQEETNFEPLDIAFNGCVSAPYEHEFVLDKDHRNATKLSRVSDGAFGGDDDDFYYKASINEYKESRILICKTFDAISEIKIDFGKTERSSEGGFYVYFGNDLEQIKTATYEMDRFDNDRSLGYVDIPSNEYEQSLIINNVNNLTALTGPLYIKLNVSGRYSGSWSYYLFIKSITIRYSGQIQELET